MRKELRETQRGLDVDIDRLETWLKVINIAVAPLRSRSRAVHSFAAAPAQEPEALDMSRGASRRC